MPTTIGDTAKLIKWLRARPLLNIRALERECKMPQGCLNKALKGDYKYLSDKHLPALEKELKKYGLK